MLVTSVRFYCPCPLGGCTGEEAWHRMEEYRFQCICLISLINNSLLVNIFQIQFFTPWRYFSSLPLPNIKPFLYPPFKKDIQNHCALLRLQKGELISTGNAKFSAGADGSLYVVSPGSEESGEYICTATNAAGYAKRKVQLTVYGESHPREGCLSNGPHMHNLTVSSTGTQRRSSPLS